MPLALFQILFWAWLKKENVKSYFIKCAICNHGFMTNPTILTLSNTFQITIPVMYSCMSLAMFSNSLSFIWKIKSNFKLNFLGVNPCLIKLVIWNHEFMTNPTILTLSRRFQIANLMSCAQFYIQLVNRPHFGT